VRGAGGHRAPRGTPGHHPRDQQAAARRGGRRHQTLRAAIEWSYSLCTPAEQLLWARLSVFAGTFDLAAAEAVCAGGDLAGEEIAPSLISLVDKNVLARDRTPDPNLPEGDQPEPLFLMLNTIREFGAERLRLIASHWTTSHGAPNHRAPSHGPAEHGTISPEAARLGTAAQVVARHRADPAERARWHAGDVRPAEAAVRRRFIAHYLRLAERFEREPTADQAGQYQRLRREHANLRAAFDYALDLPGNEGAAVVLATALFFYWRISGLLLEAEYWLDKALERCPKRSAARARVLSTRGYIRVLLGDFANGRADAEAVIAVAVTFSDLAASGRAYSALHRALTFSRNLTERRKRRGPRPPASPAPATRSASPSSTPWTPSSGCRPVSPDCAARPRPAGESRYERTAWLFGAAAPLWERTGRPYTGSPTHLALHQAAERAACGGLGDARFWELHAAGAAAPLNHVVERALDDNDQLGWPAEARRAADTGTGANA
jgi:hypothetical protein